MAEILFGSGGLTSTQLAQVYWANENINGGTLIGGNGELAPIPEARVVWGAAAIAAVVFWRERRLILKLAQGVRRRPLWTRRGMASALRK